MWKNNVCRIIMLILVIIIISVEKVYAVARDGLDIKIIEIDAGQEGLEEEYVEEIRAEILKVLQDDLGYTGSDINNQMKIKTKITITRQYTTGIWLWKSTKYEIRIRLRK